jgi:hypothetical protein
MTDTALKAFLVAAFLPYAKAFADKPVSVKFSVTCAANQVEGTLTLAPDDYALVHEGSMVEVDIGRAFRVLSSWNDPRTPSLVIESA